MTIEEYFNYWENLAESYKPIKTFAQMTPMEMLARWQRPETDFPILIAERPEYDGYNIMGGNPLKQWHGAITIAKPFKINDGVELERELMTEIDGHMTQIMAKFIQDTKKNDHFVLKFNELHSVEPSVGYLSAASAIGMRAQFSFFTFAKLHIKPELWP